MELSPFKRRVRDAGRWSRFLSRLEPQLVAHPTAVRFAEPPIIGDASIPPQSFSVWIDGTDEARRQVTTRSLERGTVRAESILGGRFDEALTESRAPWILVIAAGDTVSRLAAERLGQAATLSRGARVITCDSDHVDRRGHRVEPRFRSGPCPDRWRTTEDSGPLLFVAREHVDPSPQLVDAQSAWTHHLAKQLAGQSSRFHIHVPALLCHCDSSRSRDRARLGRLGSEDDRRRSGLADEPSVEVIICLRDRPELLRRCMGSLLDVTNYDRLGVTLVDNGSVDSDTLELLQRFGGRTGVKILHDDSAFNFAALNNSAAAKSEADVLVFLNNDTEITDPAWLATLVAYAVDPEVGVVAPLLLYPHGLVQHAGVAVGLHGFAGHPFAGLKPGLETPFGRAEDGIRNWLAVTAACMAVRRDTFEAVEGFDDSFIVTGNDVDLGLRLSARGYRNLSIPYTSVIHDESRSRGRTVPESDIVHSRLRYGEFRTVGDPFYNPNLTRHYTDCGVLTVNEDASPTVVNLAAGGSSAA